VDFHQKEQAMRIAREGAVVVIETTQLPGDSYYGMSVYRDVLVLWDEDYDTRVLDFIDDMGTVYRDNLLAVRENKGSLDLRWKADQPIPSELQPHGDGVEVGNDCWSVSSSTVVCGCARDRHYCQQRGESYPFAPVALAPIPSPFGFGPAWQGATVAPPPASASVQDDDSLLHSYNLDYSPHDPIRRAQRHPPVVLEFLRWLRTNGYALAVDECPLDNESDDGFFGSTSVDDAVESFLECKYPFVGVAADSAREDLEEADRQALMAVAFEIGPLSLLGREIDKCEDEQIAEMESRIPSEDC